MANSSPITPAGLKKLRAELRRIIEIERPKNVAEIEEARSHGDLKENAEYHAAKEMQGKLDGRMKYLRYKINKSQVIDPISVKADTIIFGATVTLEDLDNEVQVIYKLVGEDESNADEGKISITAPIARAMLGKREGDEVIVKLPKGDREYEVIKIEYKAID
ncbi:MAG: transcription elongation factor GreA [Myxococcales bacterium]|nr:transcription elongation factor GreA [Myxococcales bacterium]MCB9748780.1 transcription elongation factor GreA [Myxococcales bacterium]